MIARLGIALHWLGFVVALWILCLAGLHVVPALGPGQCIDNGWEYAWLDRGLCVTLMDRAPSYLAAALAALAFGIGARYVLAARLLWFPWGAR